MSVISDTILLGIVDSLAATVKAQLAVVVSTEDLYTKGTREANPTDLVTRNGPTYWQNTDSNFQNGSKLYYQADPVLDYLNLAAAAESIQTLDAFLLARHLRVPKSFDDYIQYPKATTHLTELFTDTEVGFGTMEHGSTFIVGDSLPVTVDSAWMKVRVGPGAIGNNAWVLTIGVTYVDDTVGSESVSLTGLSGEGVEFNIGGKAITGLSKSGQKVILMSSTTGMVAGQTVLISDPLYATLLSANAPSAQKIAYVDPTCIGAFQTGDAVTVRDGSTNENVIIEDIDYELGKITFTTALNNSYTTAANAFVYLQAATGLALRPGRQEYHVIQSVSANVSITLVTNLRHTAYVGASAVRLIKTITSCATGSGGTTADSAIIKSKIERTPTQ